MAAPTLTITGNLTADPELRYTQTGKPVANFTVANTPKTFNRQTNSWEDLETIFMRCNVWQEVAENVAESLTKGMRVIVQGRMTARSFQTKEGDQRTVWEMTADEVAPSLRWATAQVTKTPPKNQQGYGGQSQPNVNQSPQQWGAGQQQSDPWGGSGSFGGQQDQEAPF